MFKGIRKRQAHKHNSQLDKAAAFFASSIIRIQTRIANWLNKYERCMTFSQKKIALALFCISMSILVGSILYRNVIDAKESSPLWLHQPSVVMPETYPLPDSVYLQKLSKSSVCQDTTSSEQDSINR